jgi:epsilon-lactone hydrolase
MRDNEPAPPEGIRIQERVVPFPRSISAAARAALARMVAPDGTVAPPPPLPLANDRDAWAELRAQAEQIIMTFKEPNLQTSTSVETVDYNGIAVHVARPAGTDGTSRVYLEIHGGGFVYGGGEPARRDAELITHRHGVTTCSVDYRMPPEHPYPAALDDCLAIYLAVLDHHVPQDVIVGGTSAGGNLAAALMLRARDEGLPAPAALVLLTPELDLTESGDSFEVNRLVDVNLSGSLADSIALYAGDHDLSHPYLSPLFGDFTRGFPPTFLQAGTRDLFLSNAVRMHRALRRANIPVELHIFEGMPHIGFQGAPEDAELAAEVDRFVAEHWGRVTPWSR